MRLQTKSFLLIWVLLTLQHGRCDDIPQPAQKPVSIQDTRDEPESSRDVRLAPPYGSGGLRRLLPHYDHGLTGLHHGYGDLVTAHHGLGGHRGLELIHGHGLGDTYGSGFHGGLLGGHHTILPLHRMRQVSDDNEFNPPNRLIFYGHPERNQITDIVPAFQTPPVSQKYGIPLVQTNGLYEPQLRYNIAGIHPHTRLWHYPGEGVHGIGVGMGANYGPGTPEQYRKGFSGHHAGWTSAFHELNDVHGLSGLGKRGLPKRDIPGHYGEVTGHGVMGVPVMEIHKNIPNTHGSSSSGYGSTMGGYHAMMNDVYQGLDNDYNFGLHKDMHVGGTGKYHGASQYHGDGYYGMAGYHRDKYLGDGYHGGGYHAGGHHTKGHQGINGYHRGGYHGNNYHVGGYKGVNGYCGMNGYYESGCHKGGVTEHHGSFKYGGSSQGPISYGHGNQLDKLETDQNNKFSIFKERIYLKRDNNEEMYNNEKDSSQWGNQPPSTDGKFSGSETLQTETSDTNYKMEENNESASLPEGMGNESKENATDSTSSYSVVQPELVKQKNAMHGYSDAIYSDSTVRSNKTNDMEEVSRHDTTSPDNLSMKNNFLYNTGMSLADYPSVLSNGEQSATPYARGLLIDLLHGGTATLDAGNSDWVPDGVSLTGAETASGGAQNRIPAKHTPGGTYLTESGSRHQASSKIQQYQQNPQELGQLFKDNADGKLWTRYNSRKYDYRGGDFDYGIVPSTYWPWYNSYSQYYTTSYPSVQMDYGYGLRQPEMNVIDV